MYTSYSGTCPYTNIIICTVALYTCVNFEKGNGEMYQFWQKQSAPLRRGGRERERETEREVERLLSPSHTHAHVRWLLTSFGFGWSTEVALWMTVLSSVAMVAIQLAQEQLIGTCTFNSLDKSLVWMSNINHIASKTYIYTKIIIYLTSESKGSAYAILHI